MQGSTASKGVWHGPPHDAPGARGRVAAEEAHNITVHGLKWLQEYANINSGWRNTHPMRVALQPDGRYLCVGNDWLEPGESGVAVIDSERHDVAGRLLTAPGHHEIAFTQEFAYIRCKGSEVVVVIPLRQVGQGWPPAVSRIQYGRQPPPFMPSPMPSFPRPRTGMSSWPTRRTA